MTSNKPRQVLWSSLLVDGNMSNIAFTLTTLCVLSFIPPNIGLTIQETTVFESKEIQVAGTNVRGFVTVGTTNNHTNALVSNGIPDHNLVSGTNMQLLEQNFKITFDEHPKMNPQPTCLPSNSIIGFATNGVAIFSPFDEHGNDVNADIGEQDCQGKTSMEGIYYYAQVPDRCSTYIPDVQKHDANEIYGVALDGFPIYGPGSGENKVTNADLDACHGKLVDGQYRYYMTDEWPYVLGCFRGTPVPIQEGDIPTGMPYMAPQTSVCQFACNNNAKSDDILCKDDFPDTTEIPDSPLTKKFMGLTETEVVAFKSASDTPLGDELLRGFVEINTTRMDTLTFASNSIPDHPAETSSNANTSYKVQDFKLTFPREPFILEEPLCLPSPGIIGFATNGVALFSPYDSEGDDVNLNISHDSCKGQKSTSGVYHYTQLSDCVYNRSESSHIFGVALDGFPIYGPPGPDETPIDNEDLDICHGRVVGGQYTYYTTDEFPYILGCFRGVPQEIQNGGTKLSQSIDCKFACNINEDTSSMDRSTCGEGVTNKMLYIIIIASGSAAVLLVFLVVCLICCVKCNRKGEERSNNCASCESEDEEYDYHL